MSVHDPVRQRLALEQSLRGGGLGFAATYMALGDLSDLLKRYPAVAVSDTISACRQVLEAPDFASQTQAFFLYKRAAEALSCVITGTKGTGIGVRALETVEAILGTTQGHPHRASAEAIGSLPLSVAHPEIGAGDSAVFPCARWRDVLQQAGADPAQASRVLGRTVVVEMPPRDEVLAVKLALNEDTAKAAVTEALWMERLTAVAATFPVRFDVPRPIPVRGSPVFRLDTVPSVRFHRDLNRLPVWAIAFVAHRDYFAYPNDHCPGGLPNPRMLKEVIFRNAWLLARLAALGMVHTAPIPLFHNRVQRGRRPDQGLYEWERGGRLDRWLESCRYPNFGSTGLRDFEHVVAFRGSTRDLYGHLGAHLLSLFLTAGSYFRHKAPQTRGFDDQGNPVDVRGLFDPSLFAKLVEGVFMSYYEGFTGYPYKGKMPADIERLVSRMIEEMGVDRHMEEVLRVADQTEMSHEAFREFLGRRGYTREAIRRETKGVRDITAYTGPHLGGFNEGISLPELIETVGTMAALCIAGRYRSETLGEEGIAASPSN